LMQFGLMCLTHICLCMCVQVCLRHSTDGRLSVLKHTQPDYHAFFKQQQDSAAWQKHQQQVKEAGKIWDHDQPSSVAVSDDSGVHVVVPPLTRPPVNFAGLSRPFPAATSAVVAGSKGPQQSTKGKTTTAKKGKGNGKGTSAIQGTQGAQHASLYTLAATHRPPLTAQRSRPLSCGGRCGQAAVPGSTAKCSCDAACVVLGDCCADHYQTCSGGSAVRVTREALLVAMASGGSNGGNGSGGVGDSTSSIVHQREGSCAGKCGGFDWVVSSQEDSKIVRFSHRCFCDKGCAQAGDCCADIDQRCG
jgi:hypothetical protein